MEEIKKLLKEVLNREFIRAVISSPKEKEGTAVLLECGTEPVQGILKIKVRPLEKRGELMFQLEAFTKTQAFHRNLNPEAAGEILATVMERFGQMQLETVSQDCTVLISKKGKVTIRRKQKKIRAKAADLSHNRKKRYILEEGVKVPFLQDLGCGKSYLTFAMYYYLHELKKYDIRIIGLDLKSEVIRHCNELAEKYGYEKLQFLEGDIADYEGVNRVDMVVTLHACNTATDYALAKAVGWNAKVILSVPCCQHEINEQFEAGETPEVLATVMEYGLLRERFAALVTDGLRAKYLESEGYETQVLEFIDMEHTPKNILLRAVRRGKTDGAIEAESRKKLEECEAFLNIQPTLGRLLSEKSRHR